MSEIAAPTPAVNDWRVVHNHEGRHSIWPATLPVPDGWVGVDVVGDKSACLAWISENWTDDRPAGVGVMP